MKNQLLFILLILSTGTFAQNLSQYTNIALNTAADCRKAEPYVSLAADLIYSTPIEKENINRKNAISFIVKWMSSTSDYSFVIDEILYKITNRNFDLISVYYACIAKYALQKGTNVDRNELKYNSFRLLSIYCSNPDNNYTPKGDMKKMLAAYQQGKLQEYLEKLK